MPAKQKKTTKRSGGNEEEVEERCAEETVRGREDSVREKGEECREWKRRALRHDRW